MNTNNDIFSNTRVLVVDDEDILAWSIETELKSNGAEVTTAGSIQDALSKMTTFSPDAVITDLRLPDGNGMELLKKWRKDFPELPIIIITAHGAMDSAITAVREGAFDYLQKPFDLKDLVASTKRALEMSKLRQKVSRLAGHEKTREELKIVGKSAEIEKMRARLKKIASSKANTALILGPSGAGKELAARALHEWSPRKNEPFVEINCASIPETLLESELFGYERGAFTDARERKLGLFEMARNGTIFLDEIGEMPLKLQSKLLRALEYRRFKRLGGTKDIEFTGRIVAATNRNLATEVAEQRFRGDLYYRLNVLPIEIPTLAERKADIPDLTEFFVEQLSKELEMQVPTISSDAIQTLIEHNWPGNIRELKNVLQRALVFHSPSILKSEHIDIDRIPAIATPVNTPLAAVGTPNMMHSSPTLTHTQQHNGHSTPVLPETGIDLDQLEKSFLEQALERTKNNQTKAAALLGISRHTLRYRLEKHGILQAH